MRNANDARQAILSRGQQVRSGITGIEKSTRNRSRRITEMERGETANGHHFVRSDRRVPVGCRVRTRG